MFITRKHLARREMLKGMGATLALPLLDAMVPALAAQAIGQESMQPSLELATEDHSGLIGACDRDYGCIYMNTLSWRTPTTPLPMEINPRKVFERMFGQGGTASDRLARTEEDRSVL